jgi:hypothetical protein
MKNFTATACQRPIRNATKKVSYPAIAGMILAIIAVALRVIYRLPGIGGHFGSDDVTIICSTIVMIPLSILAVFITQHGLGRDIWTIPFENITYILRVYFFDAMIYVTSFCLTRISILLLYKRIFGHVSTTFVRCANVLILFIVGYMVAFDLALLFQCRPIKQAWEGWDGEHEGTCVNVNAIGWSAAALNIALDIATIVLPLPHILKLRLATHKKATLVLIFLLGLL